MFSSSSASSTCVTPFFNLRLFFFLSPSCVRNGINMPTHSGGKSSVCCIFTWTHSETIWSFYLGAGRRKFRESPGPLTGSFVFPHRDYPDFSACLWAALISPLRWVHVSDALHLPWRGERCVPGNWRRSTCPQRWSPGPRPSGWWCRLRRTAARTGTPRCSRTGRSGDAQQTRSATGSGLIMTHRARQLLCGVGWECPISEERLCEAEMCFVASGV